MSRALVLTARDGNPNLPDLLNCCGTTSLLPFRIELCKAGDEILGAPVVHIVGCGTW